MSTPPKGKLPLPELGEMKRRGEKIVMVTAYDAPGARFAEDAGVDVILVGDTAAMVVLGHEGTTVPVTMDEMLLLTRTVARAARHPVVVGDMPFGSFQVSDEKAVENAVRFVKEAGADAVKLEGAGPMLSRVKSIVEAGIPVMGHVGLTPQSATMLGGFKTQGKTAEAARKLVDDALALEEVGAFSVVLEAVPVPVAAEATRRLSVPTIGIGAGRETDGQVLVYHDLLGLTEGHLPRFVKRYANLSREIRDALEAYADEVRAGTFPEDEHTYEMSERGARALPELQEPESDEAERPGVARHDQGLEEPVAGPRIGAAGPEEVVSVDREPDRPDEKEREREWGRGKSHDMARLTVRRAGAEAAGQRVHHQASEPVDEDAVERAAEKRPREDREDRALEHRVVEDSSGDRGREHARDPGEEDQCEHGLLPGLGRFVRVVPNGGEHGAWALEDRERSQPPLLLERHGRLRGGVHSLSVLCAPCPAAR